MSESLDLYAEAVVVDMAANTLELRVPGLPDVERRDALLDVGANGRLLGVEIDNLYIQVMPAVADGDPHARSASVTVGVDPGEPAVVSLPRRGPGWEITYPSGNECWQTVLRDGQLIQICAIRAG